MQLSIAAVTNFVEAGAQHKTVCNAHLRQVKNIIEDKHEAYTLHLACEVKKVWEQPRYVITFKLHYEMSSKKVPFIVPY